jgi:ATP-binding cassette subfamily E protein 1
MPSLCFSFASFLPLSCLFNSHDTLSQNFFTKLLEDDIKAIIKPQYVDQIPRAVKGTVEKLLARKDSRNVAQKYMDTLELTKICERKIADLSGGNILVTYL